MTELRDSTPNGIWVPPEWPLAGNRVYGSNTLKAPNDGRPVTNKPALLVAGLISLCIHSAILLSVDLKGKVELSRVDKPASPAFNIRIVKPDARQPAKPDERSPPVQDQPSALEKPETKKTSGLNTPATDKATRTSSEPDEKHPQQEPAVKDDKKPAARLDYRVKIDDYKLELKQKPTTWSENVFHPELAKRLAEPSRGAKRAPATTDKNNNRWQYGGERVSADGKCFSIKKVVGTRDAGMYYPIPCVGEKTEAEALLESLSEQLKARAN